MDREHDTDPRYHVIPKEKAVFWMDGQGRWHNEHGPFEHKKIIEYFNAAIQKDADGYYVSQSRDGIIEKVYFPYQETALFVMDLEWHDPIVLLLNTGERFELSPELLFIKDDQLFHRKADEIVKFSSRALLKISEKVDVTDEGYAIRLNGKRYPVPEQKENNGR